MKKECKKRHHNVDDKTGKTYGHLTVISFAGTDPTRSKTERTRWTCLCVCGNQKQVSAHSLVTGRVSDCGCKRTYWSKPTGHSATTTLFSIYKKSAKDRSLSFDLSRDIFVELVSKPCGYCGTEPCQLMKGQNSPTNLLYNGIDRIDSRKGYSADNCITCCKHCNYAKRSMSPEEFVNWIEKVYKSISNPEHPIKKYSKAFSP